MTNILRAELLAPAGSYESMTAAFAAGADAVYIGGSRFGARAFADNLDQEHMCQAIDYAHLHGKKLYMTVNTLVKEKELEDFYQYLRPFYECGLDAVIVQDFGAVKMIRERFPDLPVHASTQMTITGVHGARMMKEMGATRVVTARELSLEELAAIHKEVDIEIESFVHGALCYCYSGQCLMSSMIGGRSGNRGRCAQPCRLPYDVKRDGKNLNGKNEKYVLSMKDLSTLDILPEILESGVYSLKIEGRMKSPRYTAGVVSIYRKYLDLYLNSGKKGYHVKPDDQKKLLELFDRGGQTVGYYTQHNAKEMVVCKEKPAFREMNQAYLDELDQAYVNTSLREPVHGYAEFAVGKPAQLTLCTTELNAEASIPGSDTLRSWDISVTVTGAVVQEAQNQPMTEEKVRKQLEKTGNTPFVMEHTEIRLSGNVFLPVQALNELRREGLEKLQESILSEYRRKEHPSELAADEDQTVQTAPASQTAETSKWSHILERPANQNYRFIASLEELNQLEPSLKHPAVTDLYLDADGFAPRDWSRYAKLCQDSKKTCFLVMPHIFRTEADRFFTENLEELIGAGFDGLVVRNMEAVGWLKEHWAGALPPLVFDDTLYAWNHESVSVLKQAGAARITMPSELNSRELKDRGCEGEELMVYGRVPMMVSAQCIKKTTEGCSHRREILMMRDRMGKEFPVKNHCSFCYNTIYNASPLSLLGMDAQVRELRPSALRLHFTVESPREVTQCLDGFADSFLLPEDRKRGMDRQLFTDFTRGHLKRGVE